MGHADRECDIGRGEGIGDGVSGDDGDRGMRRRGNEIEADDMGAKLAVEMVEESAVSAANVKNGVNGKGIATEEAEDRRSVAQPAVSEVKLTVRLNASSKRNGGVVEDLRFEAAGECGQSKILQAVSNWNAVR